MVSGHRRKSTIVNLGTNLFGRISRTSWSHTDDENPREGRSATCPRLAAGQHKFALALSM